MLAAKLFGFSKIYILPYHLYFCMFLMTPPCLPLPICFGLNCQLNRINNIYSNSNLNLIIMVKIFIHIGRKQKRWWCGWLEQRTSKRGIQSQNMFKTSSFSSFFSESIHVVSACASNTRISVLQFSY